MNNYKTTTLNGFRAKAALARAAADPRVADIEAEGLEHGRVFIHLRDGYWFGLYQCTTKSVGNALDLRYLMGQIEKRPK